MSLEKLSSSKNAGEHTDNDDDNEDDDDELLSEEEDHGEGKLETCPAAAPAIKGRKDQRKRYKMMNERTSFGEANGAKVHNISAGFQRSK